MARRPKPPGGVIPDGNTRVPKDIANIGTGVEGENFAVTYPPDPPALDVNQDADLRHIRQMIIGELVETGLLTISQDGNLVAAGPQNRHTSLIQANLNLEYVAGGAYNWTASYLRSLPFYVDDITQAFGDDLYERIALDPKVRSCLNTFKRQTLAHGLTLTPAKQEGEDGDAAAADICRFCQVVLDNLVDPIQTTLWDALDCAPYGNRVVEQVYNRDGRWIVLNALKPKPRRSVGFVVDVYMNLCGILGLVPGQGAPILVEGMIGAPDRIPNLLPRIKFAVFTWEKKNGDPRGNSLLRPVYAPWNLKAQLWQPYLKYLCQFATPSLIGITSEKASDQVQLDANGNQVLDTNGNPVLLTPEQIMLKALLNYQNGSAITLPFGSQVQPIEMQAEGQAWTHAFAFADAQIEQAITGQNLATSEGEHMSRAASSTHQDTLGLLPAYAKNLLCSTIERDILRPLVLYNYGPRALELVPNVSLSEVEQQDLAPMWTAAAALQTAGYLSPSQYHDLDAELNLPARTEDDMSLIQSAAAAQAQMPPPDGMPVPDTSDKSGSAPGVNRASNADGDTNLDASGSPIGQRDTRPAKQPATSASALTGSIVGVRRK